jgi:hypothetical protein
MGENFVDGKAEVFGVVDDLKLLAVDIIATGKNI